MEEKRKRGIAKAISFRILATLATLAIVLLFTRDLVVVGIIGIVDFVLKLGIYYVHERMWNRVEWGKERAKVDQELD